MTKCEHYFRRTCNKSTFWIAINYTKYTEGMRQTQIYRTDVMVPMLAMLSIGDDLLMCDLSDYQWWDPIYKPNKVL